MNWLQYSIARTQAQLRETFHERELKDWELDLAGVLKPIIQSYEATEVRIAAMSPLVKGSKCPIATNGAGGARKI